MRLSTYLFLLSFFILPSCSGIKPALINDIAIKENLNYQYEAIEVNGIPAERLSSNINTLAPYAKMPVGKNTVLFRKVKKNELNADLPNEISVQINARANTLYQLSQSSGNLQLIIVPNVN